MLLKIDSAILAFFEKWCHRFQRLTGKNNFWLAKYALMAFLFSNPIVMMMFYGTPLSSLVIFVCGISFLSCIITTIILLFSYATLDDWYASGQSTAHELSLAFIKQYGMRLSSWLMFFLATLSVSVLADRYKISYVWSLLYISFFFLGWPVEDYLKAVIPLPPGKSKVQEWQESFAAGFKKLVPIGNK